MEEKPPSSASGKDAPIPPESPSPEAPVADATPSQTPTPAPKAINGPAASKQASALKTPPTAAPKMAPRQSGSAFKKYKLFIMAGAFAAVGLAMWGTTKVYHKFFDKPVKPGKTAQGGAGGGSGVVAVNVIEVKLEHFSDTLPVVGTIAGGSEIPLRFEVDGNIEFFQYREGDRVKKGDVIARLSQRDRYLKFKQAELELKRYEKLYAIQAITQNVLEEKRLAADLAQSEVAKTTIRAPRDGILGNKDAEVGEFVTPSKIIVTLVNIETVMVRVGIIEKEIDKVFPGLKVILTVDTYPGVEFSGKVENLSPIISGGGRTLTVEARLDNEGGLLLPGMFARTKILVFEQDNTIAIPNDALEKTQTGNQVYVVTKENKAQAKQVEIGYTSSEFSQINKGLTPGELVITQRPQNLKDGSTVKIIETQNASGPVPGAGGAGMPGAESPAAAGGEKENHP